MYTHAILHAANEIDEFHYRIDENGDIVWYDIINGIFMVMPKNKESYIHLLLDCIVDQVSFCKESMDKIHCANHEGIWFDLAGKLNCLLISPIPFLSFTSFTQSIKSNWKGYLPLKTVDKLVIREGKEYITIYISANHTFADGFHLGEFHTRVQELLMS